MSLSVISKCTVCVASEFVSYTFVSKTFHITQRFYFKLFLQFCFGISKVLFWYKQFRSYQRKATWQYQYNLGSTNTILAVPIQSWQYQYNLGSINTILAIPIQSSKFRNLQSLQIFEWDSKSDNPINALIGNHNNSALRQKMGENTLKLFQSGSNILEKKYGHGSGR